MPLETAHRIASEPAPFNAKPLRTLREVAAIMGLSADTVQRNERSALRKLKRKLAHWEHYSEN